MSGRPRFSLSQMIAIAVGVLAITGTLVSGTERFIQLEAQAEENRASNDRQEESQRKHDEILDRLTTIHERQDQDAESRRRVLEELCRVGELSEEFCIIQGILP